MSRFVLFVRRRWVGLFALMVAIAAVVVAVGMGTARRPYLTAAERARLVPTNRWVPPPPTGRGVDAVPSWFGRPDLGTRRIAGRVYLSRAPGVATVHVRLDVPDPRFWAGRDVVSDQDGRFDAGMLPAGPYQILATAPGLASRVVHVDTATEDAAALSLYADPCRLFSRQVIDGRGSRVFMAEDWSAKGFEVRKALAIPLAGATVSVGGVEMAITDATGRYTMCVSQEDTMEVVRAPGLTSERMKIHGWVDSLWTPPVGGDHGSRDEVSAPGHVFLEAEEVVRGRVVDEQGRGVAGVTIEPWMNGGCTQADSPAPAMAITGADGRYELHGTAGAMLRMRQGGVAHDAPVRAWLGGGENRSPFMVLPPPAKRRTMFTADRTELTAGDRVAWIGRGAPPASHPRSIHGRVIHRGRPVADARVSLDGWFDGGPVAWSGPDGTFDLRMKGDGSVQLQAERLAFGWIGTVRDGNAEDTREVVIEIGAPHQIVGVIRDEHDHPLPEIHVALAETPRTEVSTDENGRFALAPAVPLGKYRIDVMSALGEDLTLLPGPDAADLDVTDTDQRQIEVVLRARATPAGVSGVVVDETGRPVAGVEVEKDHGVWTTTDAKGRFAIRTALRGPFELTATARDHRTATARGVVKGRPVRLVLYAP